MPKTIPLIRRHVFILISVGVLAIGSASCNRDGPSTGPPRVAALLTMVSGNGQSGVAGRALSSPFVVKVTDQSGAGLAGVTVTWTIDMGGGALSSVVTTSTSNGNVSTLYTGGNSAGIANIRASATGVTPVIFGVTLSAATPASINAEAMFKPEG
ncbi:MAG: Ig-like domain-containing protein [Gemmatimonadaceae bacterium]